MAAVTGTWKKKPSTISRPADLLNTVFSWSIKDIFDNNLYRGKVKSIPLTFSSTAEYLNIFKFPLIEDTRASLSSGIEETLSSHHHNSSREISSIETSRDYEYPKKLYYNITIKKLAADSNIDDRKQKGAEPYQPEPGDLLAISQVLVPRRIEDLYRTEKAPALKSYLIVFYVQGFVGECSEQIRVLASRAIDQIFSHRNGGQKLFATYLMNMITNRRIWDALDSDSKGPNMSIIERVLTSSSTAVSNECTLCHSPEENLAAGPHGSSMIDILDSFNLNESQKSAVLSTISMKDCRHKSSDVKLIWGPPGTGKTKTVASLLFLLFHSNCRTLACAPTNIAILQVAERLLNLVKEDTSPPVEHHGSAPNCLGTGDIVLYGNAKRMKIMDHDELLDVFLSYRTEILAQCLSPFNGWKHRLDSMISFLENPRKQYNTHLQQHVIEGGNGHVDERTELDETDEKRKKFSDKVLGEGSKASGKRGKGKHGAKIKEGGRKESNNAEIFREKGKKLMNQNGVTSKFVRTMTFEEYAKKRYSSLRASLLFALMGLFTHLPTSFIRVKVIKEMIRDLEHIQAEDITKLERRRELLRTLKSIPSIITLNAELNDIISCLKHNNERIPNELREFCLDNACLIFCTTSSSAKMQKHGQVEMLIIDEAAQLKECESAIPLQLPGLRHAVLIGDDRQLPAMVQSKISESAEFGRSLFQRLVSIRQEKHLLNVQYRMHPSISKFPNKLFYENQILNAPHVKGASYSRRFLPQRMYGAYSFINIVNGKEDLSGGHSRRNMMEVAVVDQIIARLFKGINRTVL